MRLIAYLIFIKQRLHIDWLSFKLFGMITAECNL